MKISPLSKYYFDKSSIVDKHDPSHESRQEKNLTHPNFSNMVILDP